MNRATLLLLVVVVLFSACSSMSSGLGGDATKVDSLRGAPPFDRRTVNIPVQREEYRKALEMEGSVNDARLVQIFHRGKAEEEFKEYRLLDVRPGSVYDILQLRQADVVVAADGYVVPNPAMFWNYLRLISRFEEGASIEIRRGGAPILMQYSFQ